MKIIVSPANYNDAIELCHQNADVIVIGENKFSTRNAFDCDLETIKKIIDNKNSKTEIWINVNAFFYEHQLNDLQEYLIALSKLKIDRIVFNDFAIPYINDELKLGLVLHYNPSTLVTSYGQFNFYQRNNFRSVSLANELFAPEVKEILNNKPINLEIAMQVHGFVLIMHSRWNLVTNFKDYVSDIDDEYIRNRIIQIREETRLYDNNIFEDEHGTHMFTGYELCLIKQLRNLYDWGLDYIWIDNILQSNNNYCKKLLAIYQSAIQSIFDGNFDAINNSLFEKCLEIARDKNKVASGFMGGIKEIKHYENK